MIVYFASILLLLQAAGKGSGAPASVTVLCHVQSLVHVTCQLPDIILNQQAVNVSVTVNNCHEPVDVTFAMTGFNLSWNFTFVPNNQNERVLIPNVFMIEPVPPVPTYLYVREPREENRERNGTSIGTNITVQASLMAQLVRQNAWEEVEFLNHTFRLPPEAPHCPPLLPDRGSHFEAGHWLTKMLVLVAGILAVASAMLVVALKRQQLIRLAHALQDRLNLVQHEQHGDTHPQVTNETPTSPVESVSASPCSTQSVIGQRGTQANGIPNGQHNILDLKSTLDSSALRYFNEVYPDERQPKTSNDPVEPSSSRAMGKPKAILFKMMKAKKEVEIGLKGITFEKLKEDAASNSHRLTSQSDVELRHEASNPACIPEDDHNFQASDKMGVKFPLDDDFGAIEECLSNVEIKNRSDSYTNVFDTSDQGEDFDISKRSPMIENPKWKVNFHDEDIVDSVEVNGFANRQRSFGYDSREYLDELEGATAVFPGEKSSKRKKSKSLKIDRPKRERDIRPYRHERNGQAGNHGKRSSLHGKIKVDTIHEVEDRDATFDTKVAPPNIEEKCTNQKKRRRGNSPNGKATVKEVLQNGFFDYGLDGKQTSCGDSGKSKGENDNNGNGKSARGEESSGVRPKPSVGAFRDVA